MSTLTVSLLPTDIPTEMPSTPTPSPTGMSPTSLTSSAALYLYTFLATLVLLLVVSSAIVVRSLFLRRRRRRLIEETIQAGTGTWSPTNNPNRRRRRNIGEKPKVWEVWLQQADEKGGDNDIMAWDDILPVYAAYVDRPPSPQSSSPHQDAERTTDPPAAALQTLIFPRPFQRRPPSPPSPSSPPRSTTALPPQQISMLRVAVLVALPAPKSPRRDSSAGGSSPVVEMGVADLEVAVDIDKDRSSHS